MNLCPSVYAVGLHTNHTQASVVAARCLGAFRMLKIQTWRFDLCAWAVVCPLVAERGDHPKLFHLGPVPVFVLLCAFDNTHAVC